MAADIVLYNAKLYGAFAHKVTALAIEHHKISALGSDPEVLATLKPNGRALDMQQRLLMPGFIDAHVHLLKYALDLDRVKLDGSNSVSEALELVKGYVAKFKPGDWVQGGGWEVNRWSGRFPTRHELDSVAPNNPVALWSKDLHSLWLNTLALKRLGINSFTKLPGTGADQSESDEFPSGILKETAADMASKRIPKVSYSNVHEAMIKAMETLHQNGITGIHDFEGRRAFYAFHELRNRGELKLRVLKYIKDDELDAAIEVGLMSGFGDEVLRVGGVKLFADGTLGSRTAHLLKPYDGQDTGKALYGEVVTSSVELANRAMRAARSGISVAIHAVGDAALRSSLNALLAALEETKQAPSFANPIRFRLEHVQLVNSEDWPRLKHPKIALSVQPSHLELDMENAAKLWGAQRIASAYPYNSMMNTGALVLFGSDLPIMPPSPITGIYHAVTRCRLDGTPGKDGWNSKERVPIERAIKAFTLNPVILSSEEQSRGSLEVGKFADIIALSDDLTTMPPSELYKANVDLTIFNGDIVFNRERLD